MSKEVDELRERLHSRRIGDRSKRSMTLRCMVPWGCFAVSLIVNVWLVNMYAPAKRALSETRTVFSAYVAQTNAAQAKANWGGAALALDGMAMIADNPYVTDAELTAKFRAKLKEVLEAHNDTGTRAATQHDRRQLDQGRQRD